MMNWVTFHHINNFVLFGLKTGDQFFTNFQSRILNELVGVDISLSDLNNTFKLNMKEDSPMKIKFVSYLKKKQVIKKLF